MAAIVQPLGEPTFEDTHREIRRELEHGLEAELGDAELPEGTIGDRLTSFARSRGHTPNGSAVGGSYGVECHLEPDTFSPHGKGGLKSDWCRLPLEPDEFCEKF